MVSVDGFADVDHKEEPAKTDNVDAIAQLEIKGEEIKKHMFYKVSWNIKGEVETSSENVDKQLQQRTMMISKNLNKFEMKVLNIHYIPNTGLVNVDQATSMYTEFEDDCL